MNTAINLIGRIEDRVSGRAGDRQNRRMLQSAFGGDGVEVFADGFDLANNFDLVLPPDFVGDHRRCREQPFAGLAEDFE